MKQEIDKPRPALALELGATKVAAGTVRKEKTDGAE
jgi:hypothetical protein